MGFNWVTFVIEIINFIVLMWLLTRFLYRPITNAIENRQRAIREEIDKASTLRAEGEGLKQRFELRLKDWEKEKAGLRAQFERELTDERARREDDLRISLQRERNAAELADRRHQDETRKQIESDALRAAAQFCARLLSRFASPELESQIVKVTASDLVALPQEQRDAIARSLNGVATARVSTRYPLQDAQREKLRAALQACAGRNLRVEFTEDERLLSGVHIDLGTVALDGNLAEELRWFGETASERAR